MIKRVKEHFLTLPQKIELLLLYGAVMFALGVGLNYFLAPEYPNYYGDDEEEEVVVSDFSDNDDDYEIGFVKREPVFEEKKSPQNDILLTELPARLPPKGELGAVLVVQEEAPVLVIKAPVVKKEIIEVVTKAAPVLEVEVPKQAVALTEVTKVEENLTEIKEKNDENVPSNYVHEHVIAKGDTLSDVLVKAGVDEKEVYYIGKSVRKVFNIRNLKIGQKLAVTLNDSVKNGSVFSQLQIFERDRIITIVKLGEKKFEASVVDKELKIKRVYASGAIKSSLYGLGSKLNVPLKIMADFIKYYSFDVDFQRDLQKGNKFAVMYEIYLDDEGKKIKNGNLIYGSLTVGSEELNIYRHTVTGKVKDVDYYTDAGVTLRKSLMKTPINGAVISSPYGKRRHPILGYTKVHKGVDFAAPRGTPFYAAGDGVIEFIGRNGSYGNYIRIRHGSVYKTAYGHLKGFAKGMRKGRRVRQGQIIAYVGTTGRSTGPHLHYEILKNDRQINPMKIKIPARKRLSGVQLNVFNRTKMTILQQLKQLSK